MSRSTPEFRAGYLILLAELQARQRRGECLDERINIYARREVLEVVVEQKLYHGVDLLESGSVWPESEPEPERIGVPAPKPEPKKPSVPAAKPLRTCFLRDPSKPRPVLRETSHPWETWPRGARGSGGLPFRPLWDSGRVLAREVGVCEGRAPVQHGFNEVVFRREMLRPWRRV